MNALINSLSSYQETCQITNIYKYIRLSKSVLVYIDLLKNQHTYISLLPQLYINSFLSINILQDYLGIEWFGWMLNVPLYQGPVIEKNKTDTSKGFKLTLVWQSSQANEIGATATLYSLIPGDLALNEEQWFWNRHSFYILRHKIITLPITLIQ